MTSSPEQIRIIGEDLHYNDALGIVEVGVILSKVYDEYISQGSDPHAHIHPCLKCMISLNTITRSHLPRTS